MNIGNLRKRVAVQAETKAADGAGGYTLAWMTLATFWANIKPTTGREFLTHGHLEGRVTHKVTLRWPAALTITTDMRLLYGARVFNIRAVMNEDEANMWAVLLVEEGGAS